MNMQLNSLPTKTWNHLHMNGAVVTLEGDYQLKVPEVEIPSEMAWTEQGSTQLHGAAAELGPVLESLPVSVAETAPDTVMDKAALLTYQYAPGEKSAGHLMLHAGANSRMQVIVTLTSQADAEALLETEIYADDHAQVDLFLIQLVKGTCMNHIGGICGQGAKVTLTRLELGADRLYSGVNMDLSGQESSFRAEIGYRAKPRQALDMNYVVVHQGKKTESLMEINGTLEENSRKIFRGTIDFRQGSAGAKGTENENVLLMSEDVVNQTLPVILCKEEDVEGNHGASIGQLDDDILFYLGSRGISQENAREMIAHARIEAICQKIPSEAVQKLVREFAQ